MSYNILVKGNIIAKSGIHVFKDMTHPIPELSNDDYFDIIHGDSTTMTSCWRINFMLKRVK